MPLYDFLAPGYDLLFEKIFLPFRERALERLAVPMGALVLDLACGSGQNFPFLAKRLGAKGRIIGLDISTGMLRRAGRRAQTYTEGLKVSLIPGAAASLTSSILTAHAGVSCVDFVLCTHGLSSMRDPESAFRASWNVLKPGGGYLVHDVHVARRTLHTRAVEIATHSSFADTTWRPLQAACDDFRMDYLDPSAHLFGGRLFVAWGTKPLVTTRLPPCPS